MRSLGLLTAAAITAALLMAVTANASTDTGVSATKQAQQQISSLRKGIQWHRSMTWHFQDRAGVRRTRTEYAERRTRSLPYLHWINDHWSHLQIQASHLAARVPQIAHLALWLCIHGQEAAWNDENSGGNGHFGGLQMTKPWGKGVYYVYDAAALSPYEQMRKAELGYKASGYSRVWLMGQWDHPDCLAYA